MSSVDEWLSASKEGGAKKSPRAAVPPPGQFLSYLIAPPTDAEAYAAGGAGPAEAAVPGPPQAAPFRDVERRIAGAKAAMDEFEDDPSLVAVLRAVDLYAGLKWDVKRRFGAQVVTNAWLKMYEIAVQMGLVLSARVPSKGGAGAAAEGAAGEVYTHELRAFCNAELPGAFVCALNHLLCTDFPETRFAWVGSSLYPEPGRVAARAHAGAGAAAPEATGDILGDYYGLLAHNPSRWLMGPDMRGDVTAAADVDALVAGARAALGEVDLYTSDVGIDVSEDYNRQEELTARIHLGQTLTGLRSLRAGGAFVVKTYTFFHPFSVSLIAVLAAVFDSFYVVKPLTSRAANSEVYLVGVGFRGLAPALERRLAAALARPAPPGAAFDLAAPLVPVDGPETENTIASTLRAARGIFLGRQEPAVENVVALFRGYRRRIPALRHALKGAAREAKARWLRENPVTRVAAGCLVPYSLESARR